MKDPNAMTANECRDWLLNHTETGRQAKLHCIEGHPIPDTLDEAAKLPEGWRTSMQQRDDETWGAEAHHREWIRTCNDWKENMQNYAGPKHEIGTGTTEKEARFRLRVAVERLARQGEGGGE